MTHKSPIFLLLSPHQLVAESGHVAILLRLCLERKDLENSLDFI